MTSAKCRPVHAAVVARGDELVPVGVEVPIGRALGAIPLLQDAREIDTRDGE